MTITITIDDPIADAHLGAIEVTVRFTDTGEARWCFFMTPEALRACGDTLDNRPDVRVHLGVPHMIVVDKIDEGIIHEVLRELEARGELLNHTTPLGQPDVGEDE